MLPSWLNASFAIDTAVKVVIWLWPLLLLVFRKDDKCLVSIGRLFGVRFPWLPTLVGLCLTVAFLHTMHIVLVGIDTWGIFQPMWLFMSFSAAIIEELAFRGYFFNVHAARFGIVKATLINSLFFAVYHFPEFLVGQNFGAVFSLRFWIIAVMGAVFSLVFAKWKHIGMVMMMHFSWNMLCFWFALS